MPRRTLLPAAALIAALIAPAPAAASDGARDLSRAHTYALLLEEHDGVYVSDELAGALDREATALRVREAARGLDVDDAFVLVVPGWPTDHARDLAGAVYGAVDTDGLYLVVPVQQGRTDGSLYVDHRRIPDGPVSSAAISYTRLVSRPGDPPEDVVRVLADAADMEDEALDAALGRAQDEDRRRDRAIATGPFAHFLYDMNPWRERVRAHEVPLYAGMGTGAAVAIIAVAFPVALRSLHSRKGWAR